MADLMKEAHDVPAAVLSFAMFLSCCYDGRAYAHARPHSPPKRVKVEPAVILLLPILQAVPVASGYESVRTELIKFVCT
jgi:hypothetical protein